MSLIIFPGKIYGDTLYVGSGDSIQAAIDAAASGDTIMVAAGKYTENLTIDKSITLTGAGASNTIINGNSKNRCINIYKLNNADLTVSISGFTITGGSAGGGGGIYNYTFSTLNLSNSTISSNVSNEHGGGIKNSGTLDITGCTISGNTATWGLSTDGGGIYNDDGNLTITGSTISGNKANGEGGGIFKDEGPLTITNCTISGNTSGYNGGGIYNYKDSLTITNSTISGNKASDEGGGIYNDDNSTTAITNSTISSNKAENGDGGGIYNDDSTLTINNSTISGNTATVDGAGIYNIITSPITDATNNWWGTANGPYNVNTNPSGTGNSVSDNVDYTPWLTNPVVYTPLNPLSPQDWVFENLNIDELLALYGPTPEGLVKMLYDTILGRLADLDGQNYWVTQLNSGAFGASQVVEHFIFSDELGSIIDAMTNEEFITFLYNSFLSRNPDSEGFENWVIYINSGVSKLDTLRVFMNNQEWFDICAMFNVAP